MTASLSAHDALVAVMITTSAADEQLRTEELLSITRLLEQMPAFDNYDPSNVKNVSAVVFDMLEVEDGLNAIVGLVKEALPAGLNETAYVLACDVAASDNTVKMQELRWLEILRNDLEVDALAAAAIERAAQARHRRIT